ncbi:MAG: hypothetical protein MJ193_00705 [Clostridia bacterium]|nr:hypothetical protein [Clostridia bacterium]
MLKEKVKKAYEKVAKIKNIKLLVILFIIAIALLIYSTIKEKTAKTAMMVASVETTMDADETRLANILESIKNAGEVKTIITQKDGNIVGVVIVAEGADDIAVRIKLIDATATALGIDKNIINVYKMK